MWKYKTTEIQTIEDFPENTFGFIYQVHHIPSGKKYIGKKVLYFNRKLPPLAGAKRKRKVVKESDWKNYYGSNPEIKKLLKEGTQSDFTREILCFTSTKKLLTYYELKYLCMLGTIEPGSIYINDNILGKFFRKDFTVNESK